MRKFRIVAHRGASGYAPENTIAAIKLAVEAKADAIEIDVHQTKDGKIIVIHDAELDRTTNGSGPVHSLTYKDISKYDAGAWFAPEFEGEHVPLLDEVIEETKGKTGLLIEIKFGSQLYPGIEKNVWSTVRNHGMEDNAIISSSAVTVLNRLRQEAPGIRLAKVITPKELWRSLFQPNSFIIKQKLIDHIYELHPHWSFIDSHFMEWAESHDLPVIPWTVNKKRKIRAMLDRGAHGIITNYPDLAKNIE